MMLTRMVGKSLSEFDTFGHDTKNYWNLYNNYLEVCSFTRTTVEKNNQIYILCIQLAINIHVLKRPNSEHLLFLDNIWEAYIFSD